MKRLIWTIGPVVALLVAGCGTNPIRETGISEIAVTLSGEPEANSEPSTRDSSPISEGIGQLSLLVLDTQGKARAGVEVEIRGPVLRLITSDDKGKVNLELPAGYYSARITSGCKQNLDVLSGGSARLGVAANQTVEGELSVQWRRRIAPAGPVFSSYTPYWPIGKEVDIRFNVVDRCNRDAPFPHGDFASFRYKQSGPIQLVGQAPTQADQRGFGQLTIVCTAEGIPSMTFFDHEQPSDSTDLTQLDASSGIKPECRST